jgi:hypothetical protein
MVDTMYRHDGMVNTSGTPAACQEDFGLGINKHTIAGEAKVVRKIEFKVPEDLSNDR